MAKAKKDAVSNTAAKSNTDEMVLLREHTHAGITYKVGTNIDDIKDLTNDAIVSMRKFGTI